MWGALTNSIYKNQIAKGSMIVKKQLWFLWLSSDFRTLLVNVDVIKRRQYII